MDIRRSADQSFSTLAAVQTKIHFYLGLIFVMNRNVLVLWNYSRTLRFQEQLLRKFLALKPIFIASECTTWENLKQPKEKKQSLHYICIALLSSKLILICIWRRCWLVCNFKYFISFSNNCKTPVNIIPFQWKKN